MRSLLAALLTIGVSVAVAQSFVPNGDFEQFAPCPTLNSQIDRAAPWFNAFVSVPWGPGPTPDYLNACTTAPAIDVPSNSYGEQVPHSGSAYAGFMVFLQFSPDFREYLEVPLTEPLVAGTCYELSLHLSLAERIGNTASGDIAAYFSAAAVEQTLWDTLPVVPQLDHLGGLLTDTVEWVHVSGIFQAQGGEQYLTIGNFHSDATTVVQPLDALPPGVGRASYYFIDDVSLEPVKGPAGDCGALGINDAAPGTASWLLDRSGDELELLTAFPGPVSMTLYDLSGHIVLTSTFDQRTRIGIGHLAEGLYLFELVDRTGATARGKFLKP